MESDRIISGKRETKKKEINYAYRRIKPGNPTKR